MTKEKLPRLKFKNYLDYNINYDEIWHEPKEFNSFTDIIDRIKILEKKIKDYYTNLEIKNFDFLDYGFEINQDKYGYKNIFIYGIREESDVEYQKRLDRFMEKEERKRNDEKAIEERKRKKEQDKINYEIELYKVLKAKYGNEDLNPHPIGNDMMEPPRNNSGLQQWDGKS